MKKYVWFIIMIVLMFNGNMAAAKDISYEKFHSINAKPVTNHPKILFVGNSHTTRNRMAQLFEEICASAGIHAEVTEVTHGGYSISRYVYPGTEEEKVYHNKLFSLLKNQKWDYIILQGRLMETEKRLKKMKAGIKRIQDMVKNTNAQLVLFMPPEAKRPSNMKHKNITTRKLYRAYKDIAKEYQISMAPVSVAYSRAKRLYPEYRIYHRDGVHPSKLGSYLSACTIFGTLFPQKIKDISYTGNMPKNIIFHLQEIAYDITA